MKEQLKTVLNFITPFPGEEMEQVLACFKARTVPRDQPLLKAGDTCREFYFVVKGCIRIYFMDEKGHEKTRYIMPDNHIGTALTSFISARPSFERIDALCDTGLMVISHDDFYRLNEQCLSWKIFYQKILEMAYSFQTRRLESVVTLNARQRFEQAKKENPSLFRLVSNKVLASYLDMTPETLSRLKSESGN